MGMGATTVAAIVLCPRGNSNRDAIRRAALAGLASLCRPVIVLSNDEVQARREVSGLPVDVAGGSSPSEALRLALTIAPHLDAAVFLRCDQTHVTAGSIRRLLDAFRGTRQGIVAAAYEHGAGLPVLCSRALFPRLTSLPGDRLKAFIEENAAESALVPMPEAASEMDSVTDYAASRH
jgi:CTP:molybdopterin cytidylyltransferase MocA